MPRQDYAIAAGTVAYQALTGSAFEVDAADPRHVIGTGAAFTTEAIPGRTIWLAAPVAQARVVVQVLSDDSLYVTQDFTVIDTATAGQYLALGGLRELGITDPRGDLLEYSQEAQLVDGNVRGLGWQVAVWRWTFQPALVVAQLRAYVGVGRSLPVSIRTRTNALIAGAGQYGPYQFTAYRAIMVWPQRERQDAARGLDLEVRFQRLLPIAPA